MLSFLTTSSHCLFIQAVEEFLGNVRSREQPHNAGLVSQPTAVKFLRARKFDVTRAIELFQAYKVRHLVGLHPSVSEVSHDSMFGWLFFKIISLCGLLGLCFFFFYLTFLKPSPRCLIIPRPCKVCVELLARSQVRSIYRWMSPKLHFASNICTAQFPKTPHFPLHPLT